MRKELIAVNSKIEPIAAKLAQIEHEMYGKFRSQTAYEREHESIPWPHVKTTLRQYQPWNGRWGSYTGFCEPVEGKRLLDEKELLENALAKLNSERDVILEPYRQRLAATRYAKEYADYERRLAEYEKQLPQWEERQKEWGKRKEQWEATQPKEVLPVGVVDSSEIGSVTDLGLLFPRWGINKGRNSTWRFVCHGSMSKPGKCRVSVERPKTFPEPEPKKPWKPNEPQKPG
jgi:hypothetical protein